MGWQNVEPDMSLTQRITRDGITPQSVWGGHQDAMTVREAGWIQLYCETVQEVLDTTVMAFRLAEGNGPRGASRWIWRPWHPTTRTFTSPPSWGWPCVTTGAFARPKRRR